MSLDSLGRFKSLGKWNKQNCILYNSMDCVPLVGNHLGSVQIVNMSSGQIEKEYSVHTSIVR